MPQSNLLDAIKERNKERAKMSKEKLKELTKSLFDFADEYYPNNHPPQITETIAMIQDVLETFYQ